MEYPNKCCIVCMEFYTSGDYVHFNNTTDKLKVHNIGLILNHMHGMFITALLKITEETFVFLPNLFVKINA